MKSNRALCLAFAIGVLNLYGASPAVADIAPDPLSGGVSISGPGKKNTQIQMTGEKVVINVSPTEIVTKVDFVLANKGPDTSLDVGFPHSYVEENKLAGQADELGDFVAIVDGKPVANVEDKPVTSPVEGLPGKTSTTYWKVWKMTFAANQTYRVSVSYNGAPRGSVVPSVSAIKLDASGLDSAEKVAIREKLASKVVEYVLITGGYWSGVIGHCTIEMNLIGFSVDNVDLKKVWPKPTLVNREQLVWQMADFKPDTNVYMSFSPNISKSGVLPCLESLYREYPSDPYIIAALGDYLGEHNMQRRRLELYAKYLTANKANLLKWQKAADASTDNDTQRRAGEIENLATAVLEKADKLKFADISRSVAPFLKPYYTYMLQHLNADPTEYGYKPFRRKALQRLIALCNKSL